MRPSIPENDDGVKLIPNIPPGAVLSLEGESQGGTTITLAFGSPRRPFSSSGDLPVSIAPARLSTAPARQTTRAGRPYVKTAKAQKAKEDRYLPESQPR